MSDKPLPGGSLDADDGRLTEDVWAEEAGRRVRVMRLENGSIRFEITDQHGARLAVGTVASFRVERLMNVMKSSIDRTHAQSLRAETSTKGA